MNKDRPTIAITVQRGDRVRFSYPNAGWDPDVGVRHLAVGREYTVSRARVHGFLTEVWLMEIPGVAFNSVQFAPVEESCPGEK